MEFTILYMILITIYEAKSNSLLKGTYDPNSTVLIKERRDLKEVDVLRQLINQETLRRVSMVSDVKAVVGDVRSVKRRLDSTETMFATLLQTIQSLKRDVAIIKQDGSLAQKIDILKRQIDALNRNSSLQQTVEAMKREVDFLRHNRTLQNTVESLKRQIKNQKRESKKNFKNFQNRLQQFDQKFKILNEIIMDIIQYLTGTEDQTLGKGLKLTRDCKNHSLLGNIQSGVYSINPFGNETRVMVYCDMETKGGGWTVIQKRVSGAVRFIRTWAEYKIGFGNPRDSYWIGNDVIHQLTKGRNSSLYVSITLTNGTKLYELYNQFSVADEMNNYRLLLGGPATGTLGDSMMDTGFSTSNLSGMSFSTVDRDNDKAVRYKCAILGGGGGWWYNDCYLANLNGLWALSDWYKPWYPPLGSGSEIKETLMMIKPQ